MARRILNLLEGLLNLVTVLIIVVVGAYSGYALWDNQQIYASAGNVQAELLAFKKDTKDIEEIRSMFAELKEINSDVSAWLTMDNTAIDYPVLKAFTNYTYLNMDVYGQFSLAGSIFLDSTNDYHFTDCYSLVHGHHMADHLMFGDLDYYKDKTFFEENRTGTLLLEDRSYELRTFSCMLVKSVDGNIYIPTTWKNDIEHILEYTRSEKALHYDNEMIERLLEENAAARDGGRKPQIIALSTCSNESSDARTIVLAEMIPIVSEEEEGEP